MADGVTWFNGPNKAAVKFSLAADQVTDNIEDIVIDVLDTAEKRMKAIVESGGINPTAKGGPRVITSALKDSAKADVDQSRGRVTGSFGFTDNPPKWTLWQERGTRRPRADGTMGGIPSMLAFATAYAEAATRMQNELSSGKWFPSSLR